MDNLYAFETPNGETLYGWGNDKEAQRYADHLNSAIRGVSYDWRQVTSIAAVENARERNIGENLADALANSDL